MPKVRPLTQAQRNKQEEASIAESMVKKFNMVKLAMDAPTDVVFASMLGVTYARYRNIKRNPLSIRGNELRRFLAICESCGMAMHMSREGLIDAKA